MHDILEFPAERYEAWTAKVIMESHGVPEVDTLRASEAKRTLPHVSMTQMAALSPNAWTSHDKKVGKSKLFEVHAIGHDGKSENYAEGFGRYERLTSSAAPAWRHRGRALAEAPAAT